MTEQTPHIARIRHALPQGVTLVCVSKFHPESAIMTAYEAGERDFGESRVQELVRKYEALPKDIRWHMIGHLQTNKVRAIVPFVHLIQSVDSLHLLQTINAEAARIHRVVDVLLEVHVARETTKTGLTPEEAEQIISQSGDFPFVRIRGLMGMATLTDDQSEIQRCFTRLHSLFLRHRSDLFDTLSMGMSDDWPLAVAEGSTMIRIGSAIFGSRN